MNEAPTDMQAPHSPARRRRLLFLAGSFPPRTAIAAVRAANVAKHLRLAGWEVDVVTVDPARLLAVRSDDRLARIEALGVKVRHTGLRWSFCSYDAKSSFRERFRLPARVLGKIMRLWGVDYGFGWTREALKACEDLRPGDIDVVLATGSPFFSFRIARSLAKRLRCPYVLDYRDLWHLRPVARTPLWPQGLMERRLLKGAAMILLVSWSSMDAMARWTRFVSKMRVITNGYDPQEYAAVEDEKADQPFIVYTGSYYPPDRTLAPVMKALSRASEAPGCPRLLYYGLNADLVRAEAAQFGVLDLVDIHGFVDRSVALAKVKQAAAAVVVTTAHEHGSLEQRGLIPGKLFEPMALRTPILLIAPQCSDSRRVVEECHAGLAFTGRQTDQIADFILRAARGETSFSFAGAEAYSWPSMVRALDLALGEVCPC